MAEFPGDLWLRPPIAVVKVQYVLKILKHVRCLIPYFFSFLEMSLLDTSVLQLQDELVTLQAHFAMSRGASFHLFPLLDPLLPGFSPMCRGSTLSCSFLREDMWGAGIMSVTYKRK